MFDYLKAAGIIAFILFCFVVVGTSEFNSLEPANLPQYEGCNC